MIVRDRRYKSIIGNAFNFQKGAVAQSLLEQSPAECAARRERV
jgi:hypothetical protein